LVVTAVQRPDEDRLQNAVLANRCGELIQRGLVEREARLLWVRLDPIDVDVADAAAGPTLAVVREEADDRRRELALFRQAPRGGGAEISSGQGRQPPAQAHGTSSRRPSYRRTS